MWKKFFVVEVEVGTRSGKDDNAEVAGCI
ncbi:hypothetical protein A2U01_0092190, partial [Trifolium medium]|nr:hypothetical protein [Trifolium medium]